MSRRANGLKRDVTAFAAMTSWLRLPAESFYQIPGESSDDEPELLAALAPLLRARRDLDADDVRYLEDLITAAARRFRSERAAQDG